MRHLLQPFLCVDVDLEGSQSPAWQTCREVGSQRVQQLHLHSVVSNASTFSFRAKYAMIPLTWAQIDTVVPYFV